MRSEILEILRQVSNEGIECDYDETIIDRLLDEGYVDCNLYLTQKGKTALYESTPQYQESARVQSIGNLRVSLSNQKTYLAQRIQAIQEDADKAIRNAQQQYADDMVELYVRIATAEAVSASPSSILGRAGII